MTEVTIRLPEIRILSEAESNQRAAVERVSARGITPEIGWRLAGLTDGEGHFGIHRTGSGGFRCAFVIKMRADDKPLLDSLCAQTGVGKVSIETHRTRHNPCARWEVWRKDECALLADIFTAYPLESKKARDAAIWMEALDEWALIYQNEKADWTRMEQLDQELKAVRKFPLELLTEEEV